ncbi:MAG: glycosyltransferase family 4 protein [Chloroflexaceae bacterium]|nr:glycosyltransferase family 4 protein [Chloroflexaceae bacterium]
MQSQIVNRKSSIVMLAPFGIRPKGTLLARMLPLAQALVRRGHRVSIVAPPVQNPADAGRRDVYEGVTVMHTAAPTLPGMAGVVQQTLALLQAALAESPQLLHLFKPKGFGGLAMLLAQALRPRLPWLVDTDDWEGWGGWNDLLPYPGPAKRLFAWQERQLPRRAAAVTVASRTLQSQVWGFGVVPHRVFYLPNGITGVETSVSHRPSPIAHRPSPTILLYTRFWEFDVRDVVAALVAIVQGCPAARLLVVGKGERGEERRMLQLAAQAGVGHALDYQGWIEPADLPDVLASADLALVPLDDTLINRARCSAKMLELMALGLPLVAGNVGQAAEYIVHGVNGMLVPPGNPGALAQAARCLIHDDGLRARLGAAARESVSAYSWDRLAPTAEAAYTLALGYHAAVV